MKEEMSLLVSVMVSLPFPLPSSTSFFHSPFPLFYPGMLFHPEGEEEREEGENEMKGEEEYSDSDKWEKRGRERETERWESEEGGIGEKERNRSEERRRPSGLSSPLSDFPLDMDGSCVYDKEAGRRSSGCLLFIFLFIYLFVVFINHMTKDFLPLLLTGTQSPKNSYSVLHSPTSLHSPLLSPSNRVVSPPNRSFFPPFSLTPSS